MQPQRVKVVVDRSEALIVQQLSTAKVVVADSGAVVAVPVTQTRVVRAAAQEAVVVEAETVRIVTVGEQGERGPPGSPRVEVAFAFGDAAPKVLFAAPAGKLVERVTLHITARFDGVGAALAIGDTGDFSRLMSASQNDPGTVGTYEVSPNLSYASGASVLLSIAPGAGALAGAGLVVIDMQD